MKCVSPFFVVRDQQWVPCQKCNFCLQKSRSELAFKLVQQLKASHSANFITLTYDDEHTVHEIKSRQPELERTHLTNFFKRLRKLDGKIPGTKRKRRKSAIRYYAVGEYGEERERPHYHILLFNLHQDVLGKVSDVWGKGHVDFGKVEPASVAYVSGYVINRHRSYGTRSSPFSTISRSDGGMGASYLTPQVRKWHKSGLRNYVQNGEVFSPLPRLFKDRLFTKNQKKIIGLKMDEVMAEKYRSEIERLLALHDDPMTYYQQKIDYAYASVRTTKSRIF